MHFTISFDNFRDLYVQPKHWRNLKSVLSKRRENVDAVSAQVWILFHTHNSFRVFIPDFSRLHAMIEKHENEVFFRKVSFEGLFNYLTEAGGEYESFLSACDETTEKFEEVMLKLLGIGLSQVRRGANSVNYHKSSDTYEKLSE